MEMVLAIDIGNTNTTIGLFDEKGDLTFLSELETDRKRTQDQCCLDLLGVFQLYRAEIGRVKGAILSSVVPPMTGNMAAAVTRLTGHKPLIVGPGLKTGMNIKADVHNQLGSDIVASSVAAFSKYETPIVVINFGTALTFSYLSDNSYEGCAITPGIRVALEALSERAAQLPHISLDGTVTPLGRNTVDAMRAGVLFGNAGAIDRMIDSMEEAAGAQAKTIVATGASARDLLCHCKHSIRLDQDLLMDGLFLLYQKNGVTNRRK
jgi:type III pantothenate kinase